MPKWPAPVWAAICAVLVYLPSLWNAYSRDDAVLLTGATPIVRADFAALATSHYWAGVEPDGNLYRPVTTGSLAVEELFVPGSPAAHRVGSLLLHALAAALGTMLLAAIGIDGPWLLLAGLWLAVHPIRSDAVCEAVQRSELLAFSGVCAVLLCEFRRRREGASQAKWLIAIGGVLFAALLAKESAIAALLLLPVFGWLLPGRFGIGGWRAGWPAVAVATGVTLAYMLLRFAVLGSLGTHFTVFTLDNPYAELGLLGRLPGACSAAALYAKLVVWPWPLAADYSYPAFDPASGWSGAAPIAGLAVMVATGVALLPGRGKPWRVLGAAWIAVTLGPFINLLFPMGFAAAERVLYAPLFGGAVWLAAAGTAWCAKRPAQAKGVIAVCAVMIAAFGLRTVARTLDWRTPKTLFAANVRVQPTAARGWMALAAQRRLGGDRAGAHAAYAEAVRLHPAYPEPLGGLGDLARDAGDVDRALDWYHQAIAVARPDDPRPHGNLGALLGSQKRYAEALPHLREAVKRGPGAPAAWRNLVQTLALMGRTAEARVRAEEALQLHPADEGMQRMHDALMRGALGSDPLTPAPGRR